IDTQGKVLTWNKGAERMNGYAADEIIGQNFAKVYPEESVAAGVPRNQLDVAIADGRFEEEGWRLRKNGNLFWASVVITP
ncbi:PAS domain S-box protein, partial [Acinetobacter baumannii]